MTTEEKFNAAVNVIRSLPKNGSYQPSNVLMLKFYAYFKQATLGPCTGRRPAFYDVVNRAKYDAWKKLGDMPKAKAMARYVEELHSIVETMSYSDKVANFLEAPTDELDAINMNDLELVAGDVIERVRSQPNSPLASREASPTRLFSSRGSSPLSSTMPLDDSDRSDDEYIDTSEFPEVARKPVENQTEHISRSRTKSSTNNVVDISQEISKAVQSLRTDIEQLSQKIEIIENRNVNNLSTTQIPVVSKGLSSHFIAFLIVWPFIASFIMHRYVFNRKQ